jgi:hypothetical protein
LTARRLAKEFLEDLQKVKKDKRFLEAAENLEKALLTDNRILMQLQLKAYVETLSDIILESSTRIVSTETFTSLADKEKATLIREYLSLGPKLGYTEAADATQKVYRELLKSSGVTASPVTGTLDSERLKGAVAGSIKHAIENDGKLERSITNSFAQIIRAGNRDTVDETSRKVKSRTGDSILVQRVTGADPCGYCVEHSGVWFEADSQETFSRYHDNCKCRLDLKIGKLSAAEKVLKPVDNTYDDFKKSGTSDIDDFDDFEDFE